MADDRGVSFHHSAAHGVRIAIGDDDAVRDDIDQQIDLRRREAAEVRGGAPSAHPARAAATPRQGIEGSAVAAVVAEVASRTRSAELIALRRRRDGSLDRPRHRANGGRDRGHLSPHPVAQPHEPATSHRSDDGAQRPWQARCRPCVVARVTRSGPPPRTGQRRGAARTRRARRPHGHHTSSGGHDSSRRHDRRGLVPHPASPRGWRYQTRVSHQHAQSSQQDRSSRRKPGARSASSGSVSTPKRFPIPRATTPKRCRNL